MKVGSILVDWDRKYKILFIGKFTRYPTYGITLNKHVVKFVEIDTEKTVGWEFYL